MQVLTVTLALPVRNLEKAKEWYRQLFAYPPTTQPKEGLVELNLGPALVQLYEADSARGDSALRLGVKHLDKLHARLREAGLAIEPISEVPGVLRYFDFQDPDGNGLSFYELVKKQQE